ncbi:MAG: type II toxin-antitoxin system RelE/ParE family toxin [Lentisphaerae bacterium]|nr:type II toxin-antitoxin system RelE/ParE family toxin [Lentisphaerota bacterium]
MARLIWTAPALHDLDAIAEYIALDNTEAARRYVQKVFAAVERLGRFPKSGSIPPEIPHLPYRHVVVSPCRIFYRCNTDTVFVIFVMRSEQLLRVDVLLEREKEIGEPEGPGDSAKARLA